MSERSRPSCDAMAIKPRLLQRKQKSTVYVKLDQPPRPGLARAHEQQKHVFATLADGADSELHKACMRNAPCSALSADSAVSSPREDNLNGITDCTCKLLYVCYITVSGAQ